MEFLFLIAIVYLIYLWANSKETKPLSPQNSDQTKTTNKIGSVQLSSNTPNSVYQGSPSEVAQEKKETSVSMIESAIKDGRMLKFEYTDPMGEITNRTVTPYTLERRHDKKILCLTAYCHLRGDPRTFVIWRMKRITLV
jgi:hypothetical protein